MSSTTAPQASSWWAFGPAKDLSFILLTPLAILLVFTAAERGGWTDGLLAFALASAMGHYLPGVLRAYGDRSLFHRFRGRLIAAPLFLFGITTALAYYNYNFIFLLVGGWGSWHWAMQVYGFARIYDAKTPAASTPPLLDRVLCLFWFGTSVFVLNDVLQVYVSRMYESGSTPLSAGVVEGFRWTWLGLTALVTLLYIGRLVLSLRAGQRPNPLKLFFIAITFAYLSYTASQIDRPAMGYALFEMWHDIQYLSIVWLFNLSRAQKNPEAGRFIRFLFRPKVGLALTYVALCLGFGSLTHAWKLFHDPTLVRVVASVVLSTAMLHYYLDGFIWRIRESETRAALGVDARDPFKSQRLLPFNLTPALRHALLWLIFLIPAGVLFAMESRGSAGRPPLMVFEELVKTFPNSPHAHYELGRELQEMGRLQEGRGHLEKSYALSPGSYQTIVHLGVLLADQRKPAEARPYFEKALELNTKDAGVRNNLAIVLEQLGDLKEAKTQLTAALELAPDYVLAHVNLGIVSSKLGDMEGAVQQLQEAVRLDPEDAGSRNTLGELLLKAGRKEQARESFQEAVRLEPDFTQARRNLAGLSASPPQNSPQN